MMKRVGIVAKPRLRAAARHVAEIASWLQARGVEPVFDRDSAELASTVDDTRTYQAVEKAELPRQVQLLLVLGGDGTLLSTAGCVGQSGADIPILGVNFGSLGFLTEVTLPELFHALEAVLAGSAQIEERLMLHAVVMRGGEKIADRVALNDVIVTQGALSRLIRLHVFVGGDFMMDILADGLIISSATGSTAYNLSAGGPIVHPEVEALVIAPIAPHTLTNRPVVVPASSEIRIEPSIDERVNELLASFDGQPGVRLLRGDAVAVSRADRPLRLVRAPSRKYFDVLREKLKWGER
jgi:NAD+ kinase